MDQLINTKDEVRPNGHAGVLLQMTCKEWDAIPIR